MLDPNQFTGVFLIYMYMYFAVKAFGTETQKAIYESLTLNLISVEFPTETSWRSSRISFQAALFHGQEVCLVLQ